MTAASLPWLERRLPPALLRGEGALVCLLAWACFLAVPLSLGEIGLGWDALNHHVYLGWTAQQPRFDRDFVAAGYQSFQAPYLYWPVYRMVMAGWSGTAAGALLASLHVLVVWPLWMLARACVPGATVFDVAMRGLAVALALLSSVVLSAFGSTMNDLLAATPLVWAVALAMQPVAQTSLEPAAVRRCVLLSGVCAGLAVTLKLSNGPLAVLLPGLWWVCGRGLRGRLAAVLVGGAATLVAFAATYGPWAWMLWQRFGNPVYPFHDAWFAPLRALTGWAG